MTERRIEQVEVQSAELLQRLGFTEYEAYTFVYLSRIGTGTARDISEMDHVPRTRVYDAMETLHEVGLVDVQYTSPRKFTTVSRETAIRKLRLQHEATISELSELLSQLEPVENRPEEHGVWTVTDREAVASRIIEYIDDAETEVVYVTVDEALTEEHLDHLEAAEERGVDVYLGGVSETVRRRVLDRLSSVKVFETLWEWSEEGAGSLLVTDQRTALVSVYVPSEAGDEPEEIAIWGSGEHNSLVVVLRAIFTWRLANHDVVTGSE